MALQKMENVVGSLLDLHRLVLGHCLWVQCDIKGKMTVKQKYLPTEATGMPREKKWKTCDAFYEEHYTRDRVRVGLETRLYKDGFAELTPKVIGTPSWMPFSSAGSRFGKGKLESGPAMFNSTSWLDRRFILVVVGTFGTNDIGGVEDVDDEAIGWSSMSSGTYWRGLLRTTFSRLFNCACWCLILCFRVDIWFRTATWIC